MPKGGVRGPWFQSYVTTIADVVLCHKSAWSYCHRCFQNLTLKYREVLSLL